MKNNFRKIKILHLRKNHSIFHKINLGDFLQFDDKSQVLFYIYSILPHSKIH